jgi:iron complex transport system substrate-binding protein
VNRGVAILLLVLGLFGCGQRTERSSGDLGKPGEAADSSVIVPRYAKGYRVEVIRGETVLVLTDPWVPGKEFARYRLVSAAGKAKPVSGLTDIRIPVTRIAASSTTHAGFLSAINARDLLVGINNPDRLYDDELYNRFQQGKIVSLGRDLDFNLEYLIAEKPSVVMQTGIQGQFSPDPRLISAGIPVLYILEWMESTPLGRAEWIRVFGMITGHQREADSVFQFVESEYNRLAEAGKSVEQKPKVLTGNNFKGTWYMPGGYNYQSYLFRDAGMDYPWKQVEQSASLALNFEAVVDQMADAPVWVGVVVDSASQLLAEEARYSVFRAVKDRKVFAVTNRLNSHGGNDYWESGVVRPDLILADLLYIAHPDMVPGHIWVYYKPLIFD